MKTNWMRIAAALVCGAVFVAGTAMAATKGTSVETMFQAAFYLAPNAPILDETGTPFPGTWGKKDGGLVEIREAGAGIVAPTPDNAAEVEAANPLLASVRMGDHVAGRDTGLFCAALVTNRPQTGVRYFIRAYDSKNPQESLLYADSEIFTIEYYSDVVTAREVAFGSAKALTAEDPYADDDGDGFTNAEEVRLRQLDSDGDGWSDWFELKHGMDPDVPYTLAITKMENYELPDPDAVAATGKTLAELSDEELMELPWSISGTEIFWPAVSGLTYVVEFADILEGPDGFKGVLTNVAESGQGVADVTEFLTNPLYPVGFFRVKAVNGGTAGAPDDGE
jgi:hypothetical protein